MQVLTWDQDLYADICARFDLRKPNAEGLKALVKAIATQDDNARKVADIATAVGKTYLMAALVEYAATQGVRHILIVTPGTIVQAKTVENFSPTSPRYVAGSEQRFVVETPEGNTVQGVLQLKHHDVTHLVITNVHNLLPLTEKQLAGTNTLGDGHGATKRRLRTPSELSGNPLIDKLTAADDLLVIADESHLYSASAASFRRGIEQLVPAAHVGLSASPDSQDEIVYTYSLAEAIRDAYVKTPVVCYREGGYTTDPELQLSDALDVLGTKEKFYADYVSTHPSAKPLRPIMFVVCSDVAQATQTTDLLRASRFFGSEEAVLQVDNEHNSDAIKAKLRDVETPDSPVRCVVSVSMLKEGWNVHNIAVVVSLRPLISEVLTEQVLGRGLRLPFGNRVGVPHIDQLDIIAHESFDKLLTSEGVLQLKAAESAEVPQPVVILTGDDEIQLVDGQELPVIGATGFGPEGPTALALDDCEAGGGGAPTPTGEVVQIGDTGVPGRDLGSVQPETPPPPVVVSRTTDAGDTPWPDVPADFPQVVIATVPYQVNLGDVDQNALRQAAKEGSSPAFRKLRRKELESLDAEGGMRFRSADSLFVSDIAIDATNVRASLERALLKDVPATLDNRDSASGLAEMAMAAAGLESWTEKQVGSVHDALRLLARRLVEESQKKQQLDIKIRAVPVPPSDQFVLLPGASTGDHHDVASQSDFVARRWYSGWRRSLMSHASFDAWSTEFHTARMMDDDPEVTWWTRLYPRDDASITYRGRNYFPDFLVRETSGRMWILEGKSVSGRDDEVVQAKRDAAARAVNRLALQEPWKRQRWGYAIAYEDQLAKADSWSDILRDAEKVQTK